MHEAEELSVNVTETEDTVVTLFPAVRPHRVRYRTLYVYGQTVHLQFNEMQQCCGSGSESVQAVCHQARIRILLSPSKNSKKNYDSYCFVTFF